MFWKIYTELCKSKNTSPNAVAAALGLSNATCTKWKQGATPGGKNLQKIADYFGVTTGYLMGETPTAPAETKDPAILELSQIAEVLSQTESGIARLNLLLEEARRLQEYEKKLAELEAQHSQQNQNTTGETA